MPIEIESTSLLNILATNTCSSRRSAPRVVWRLSQSMMRSSEDGYVFERNVVTIKGWGRMSAVDLVFVDLGLVYAVLR